MTGIKQINLNDIRHYSSYEVPGTDGNLFFIDKFHEIDFKEKSLQLGFMFFVYCKQGTVEITINDTSYNVKPGDLIVGLNELTIAETKPSEDFMGAHHYSVAELLPREFCRNAKPLAQSALPLQQSHHPSH